MLGQSQFPFAASLLFALAVCCLPAAAADETEQKGELSQRVEALLVQLADDRPYERESAAAQLERLAEQESIGRDLARLLRQALARPETPFEVRTRLNALLQRLPEVEVAPLRHVSRASILQSIQLLDADDYSSRVAAAAQVRRLADHAKYAAEVLVQLKQQLRQPGLAPDTYKRLEGLYEEARGTWLINDPVPGQLPDYSREQIQQLIAELAKTGKTREQTRVFRRAAERDLLDLLARAEYTETVKTGLEAAAQAGWDDDAAARIERILAWCKHGMVAEYWTLQEENGVVSRRHLGVQYLLIGVPQLGPGALRPSHFDSCTDKVAHCVSGNSLSPGDYRVFEAIPHPNSPQAVFHLVNLPTPRRRMAYDYFVKRVDEATRLREISERTCNAFLKGNRELSYDDLQMLRVIDPEVFSRFVSKLFSQKTKPPLEVELELLSVVVEYGTAAALPGIVTASKQDLIKAEGESQLEIGWAATLAVAARERGASVDAILAGMIEQTDKLMKEDPGDVGATAAALLLKRHGQHTEDFGLEASDSEVLPEITPHRFLAKQDRQRVLDWWAKVAKEDE